MTANKENFTIADHLDTKGYGTKYSVSTIKDEYKELRRHPLYIKEILYRLALKYNKSVARIKQIVREP